MFIKLMSPDVKLTVNRGFRLCTEDGDQPHDCVSTTAYHHDHHGMYRMDHSDHIRRVTATY